MKSWVKSLLIGLCITLVSLSLLIIFLPTLLKPALNRWLPDILQTAGIENGTIRVSHFSWQRLHIEQLQMPLSDGSLFALQDFNLRYSPAEVIRGQLKSLSIQEVTLSLAGDSGKKIAGVAAAGAKHAANETLKENPIIEIPAFKQWLTLPLESLNIAKINLQHPTISAGLQAEINPQLWRVWGETQLDNSPLPWQLEMQLQNSGDLLILISESQQLLAQLHANIEQDNAGTTRIKLNNNLDLKALSQRLLLDISAQLPLTTAELDADIRLPASLRIPQGIEVHSTLTFNSEQTRLFTDKESGQQLNWLSGFSKLTLDKKYDQGLDLTVFNQHHLSLLNDQQGYEIRQSSQQPAFIAQCDRRFEQCSANGLLNWEVTAQQQQLTMSLSPKVEWKLATGLSGVLKLDMSADQQQPSLPQGQLNSSGQLEFAADVNGNWRLWSAKGISNRLALQTLQLPDENKAESENASNKSTEKNAEKSVDFSDIHLTLLNDLLVENNQGQWHFKPLNIGLGALSINVQQQNKKRSTNVAQLEIADSSIACIPEIKDRQAERHINSLCQLSLNLSPSRFGEWPLPDASLQGPLNIALTTSDSDPANLDINAELNLLAANQQLKLRSRLQHQQAGKEQQGSLQWHMNDVPLNWDTLNLSEMTTLTQMQLLDGALSGQGWIDWQQQGDQPLQIKPDLTLRFDNVSATYDNSLSLEKWRGLFAVRRPVDFSSNLPGDFIVDAQVAGDSLNSGVKLSNILARSQTKIPADFSSALIEVYEMHTDVLGGRVHTPLIRFDTSKEINAFGIEVENIQLSELAKLEPNAEISATGVLDGVLPIVLTQEGPQVPGGTLFARAPGGIIQYNNSTSQALKASDQTVGLALQLLENFHYDQLESGVEYQPDGQLNLALQFQGHNPGFFDGQATHLNVNLDYNLLDLLESLRVTNDLIQKVEDKYQL